MEKSYLFSKVLSTGEVIFDNQESMVIEIRDDDLIVGCKANPTRAVKILPISAFEPVLGQVLAVRREQLDAVIARIADQNAIPTVDGHVPGVIELA